MATNFSGKPLWYISLQMTSRSTLSNVFWKLTKTVYKGVCHSRDCSMMMRMVVMWSVHERSCLKPACSTRSLLSKAVFSLSSIILVSTLLRMDNSMVPRQLLQDERSPFFGSFTRCPRFQSSGTRSCSQILLRSGCSMSVEVWMSAFRASGGIPSGPAALPDLRDLIALAISVLLGGLILIPRSWVGGGMSGGVVGAGRLSVSLKCSAHLALCSSPGDGVSVLVLGGMAGVVIFPRQCPGHLVQSLHVSLACCSLFLAGQLLNVASFVLPCTFLYLSVLLPELSL